jgi:hypothetical protein
MLDALLDALMFAMQCDCDRYFGGTGMTCDDYKD